VLQVNKDTRGILLSALDSSMGGFFVSALFLINTKSIFDGLMQRSSQRPFV